MNTPTNWFPINPFKSHLITFSIQLSPPPKFFDGALTQKEAMLLLFPNKFISWPPPKKYLLISYFLEEYLVTFDLKSPSTYDMFYLSKDVFRPVSQFSASVFRHQRSLLATLTLPSQDVSHMSVTLSDPFFASFSTFILSSYSIPG